MMVCERTIVYAIVGIVVLLLIWKFLKTWIRCVILALQLQGPPATPFLGNVSLLVDNVKLLDIGRVAYKLYGKILRGWISLMPVVFVLDPKDIQIIIGSSRHTDKNFFYSLMHNFIGKGLISNSGEKWRLHRKLMQPYFHINILKLYVSSFGQGAKRHVENLKGVRETNICTFSNECVVDILHETILGLQPHEVALKLESPYRSGKVVAPLRIQKPWFLLDYLYKFTAIAQNELKQRSKLYEYTKKIVNLKRKQRGMSQPSVNLLQYFLEIHENNSKFDEDSLINEICTFMLAGQESVATAISFALYSLASNPSIIDRVYSELDGIFDNSDRDVNEDDLRSMKYLEQCIKESLRLYPSIPILARRLTEDVALGDYTLPAGCNVCIAPFATHRLEHIYKNPEEYDPDRFSNQNVEKLHPYAFIPFSAGPRNCIGYKFALIEMKTIISTLLRYYRISTFSNKNVTVAYRVTLRAKGGLWLRLEPRRPSLK